MIARPTRDGGIEGRYNHYDSYPSGLGKTLWAAFHGHFASEPNHGKRAAAMQRFFIDDHPAGWSSLVGADFSLAPGFSNSYDWNNEPRQPQCYCDGDRSEDETPLFHCLGGERCDGDGCDPIDIEWAYVIDGIALDVYGSRRTDEGWRHILIASIKWDGPEPDWKAVVVE
jgi:hypothetical protein